MDRVGLLHQLATLPEHPESVPINALVAVKGTPLQVRYFSAPPGLVDSALMMRLIWSCAYASSSPLSLSSWRS